MTVSLDKPTVNFDPIEFRIKWGTELPDYPQSTGTLQNQYGNCCLGVAAKILARDHSDWLEENDIEIAFDDGPILVTDNRQAFWTGGNTDDLPARLHQLLGTEDAQLSLINANDGCGQDQRSFADIGAALVASATDDFAAVHHLDPNYDVKEGLSA